MNKSQTIQELAKALILFNVKVDSIKKDAKNPFFKSSYATLTNIIDSIKEPLAESGLSYCQFPSENNGLTTILMHESGEWIESTYYMTPAKDDPQGRGSCLTYMRRYSLSAVFGLSIEEDDDANYATHGKNDPDEKQWLNENTEMFTRAVAKLKSGETTIDKIKLAFKVSKKVETLLLNQSK